MKPINLLTTTAIIIMAMTSNTFAGHDISRSTASKYVQDSVVGHQCENVSIKSAKSGVRDRWNVYATCRSIHGDIVSSNIQVKTEEIFGVSPNNFGRMYIDINHPKVVQYKHEVVENSSKIATGTAKKYANMSRAAGQCASFDIKRVGNNGHRWDVKAYCGNRGGRYNDFIVSKNVRTDELFGLKYSRGTSIFLIDYTNWQLRAYKNKKGWNW